MLAGTKNKHKNQQKKKKEKKNYTSFKILHHVAVLKVLKHPKI